jgi:transglutaminase-like putative cysteine protease
LLRLTPRNHEGQHLINWRIDINEDCRLRASEDAFGNIVHTFTADGPIDDLTIRVEGEVETFDTHGIVRGAIERLPPELFLRDTEWTSADADCRAFATAMAQSRAAPLDKMHALLVALPDQIQSDRGEVHRPKGAAAAFQSRRAGSADFAHLLIALARCVDVPARFIRGYWLSAEATETTAAHAWIEAYIEGLGWVGFDPTQGRCPDENYVRVAMGLDSLGAAPVRGSRFGGEGESMRVAVTVDAGETFARQSQ